MVCIGVAIVGMVLIVGNGISAFGKGNLLGIFFGFIAAAFYAALILLNKFIQYMAKLEITIIQLGTTALLLFPYVLVTEGFDMLEVSRSSIILLGIVNTGIGFWVFFSGMQKLKGQSIAMLSYVDPLVAILISAVILQEQMTMIQMLGGALLLGFTFISENQSMKMLTPLLKKTAK